MCLKILILAKFGLVLLHFIFFQSYPPGVGRCSDVLGDTVEWNNLSKGDSGWNHRWSSCF